MDFGDFFSKIGTWSPSLHFFVGWFLEIGSLITIGAIFITICTITYFATDAWLLYVACMIGGYVIFTFTPLQLVDRAGRRVILKISDFVEFCLFETYHILFEGVRGYELVKVESPKRRFVAVFPPSGVVDYSPEPREVAVADEPRTTDARLGALEDAIRSLSVANASRTADARLVSLEDAVRSLSAQLAAFTANRAPKNHPHEARTVAPSRWCYYHVRYGSNARKCGSDECTFASMSVKNPST